MKQRILVIEDNLANMELITYLLLAYGYLPLTAQSGAEGMRLVRSDLPNLILCDIGMSDMNGYEVAQQIRRDATLQRTILVAVTAYAMVGDRDRILAAGFDGYLSKPIDPETFIGEVEAFFAPDQAASFPLLEGAEALEKEHTDNERTGQEQAQYAVVADRAPAEGACDPLNPLTRRQREIVFLIAQGLSTQEIAQKLFLSVKTVETHRAHLMARLNIHNVAGLVRYAIREGMLTAES